MKFTKLVFYTELLNCFGMDAGTTFEKLAKGDLETLNKGKLLENLYKEVNKKQQISISKNTFSILGDSTVDFNVSVSFKFSEDKIKLYYVQVEEKNTNNSRIYFQEEISSVLTKFDVNIESQNKTLKEYGIDEIPEFVRLVENLLFWLRYMLSYDCIKGALTELNVDFTETKSFIHIENLKLSVRKFKYIQDIFLEVIQDSGQVFRTPITNYYQDIKLILNLFRYNDIDKYLDKFSVLQIFYKIPLTTKNLSYMEEKFKCDKSKDSFTIRDITLTMNYEEKFYALKKGEMYEEFNNFEDFFNILTTLTKHNII